MSKWKKFGWNYEATEKNDTSSGRANEDRIPQRKVEWKDGKVLAGGSKSFCQGRKLLPSKCFVWQLKHGKHSNQWINNLKQYHRSSLMITFWSVSFYLMVNGWIERKSCQWIVYVLSSMLSQGMDWSILSWAVYTLSCITSSILPGHYAVVYYARIKDS